MKKTIALCLFALFLTSLVVGQVPTPPAFTKKETSESPASQAAPGDKREMTAADVETFLDGIVPLQLGLSDVAGATVSVVKDGKLLFAKGYGYADVQKKQPVSPQDTLFRPGSISKLFHLDRSHAVV